MQRPSKPKSGGSTPPGDTRDCLPQPKLKAKSEKLKIKIMNLLIFATLTIICYAIFDLFMKLSAERIHAGLGGFIINLVSAIVLLVFIGYLKIRGESIPTPKAGGGTVFYFSWLGGWFGNNFLYENVCFGSKSFHRHSFGPNRNSTFGKHFWNFIT